MFNRVSKDDEIRALKEQVDYLKGVLRDREEAIKRLLNVEKELTQEFKRKEQHAVSLMEVKLKEDLIVATEDIKQAYAEKERKLLESNFEKLSKSLEELHSKGNANTQYIEKASLKMMDMMGRFVNGKQLEAPKSSDDN